MHAFCVLVFVPGALSSPRHTVKVCRNKVMCGSVLTISQLQLLVKLGHVLDRARWGEGWVAHGGQG